VPSISLYLFQWKDLAAISMSGAVSAVKVGVHPVRKWPVF
jgi:hypothetical protein